MTPTTIMLIDDDEDILNIFAYILIDAGYQVKTGSGVTDMFEIEKDPPDLCLSITVCSARPT